MNIAQINSAIIKGNFTNDDLSSIIDAVKFARSRLTQKNKFAFKAGSPVKFTSNRNGVTYNGIVDKVKIKYILVKTNAGMFNVPANMLEAA
jgi:hypothetical protein